MKFNIFIIGSFLKIILNFFITINLISWNFNKITVLSDTITTSTPDIHENDHFETFLELPDDIDLNPQQGRNGIRSNTLKWPNGILPYVISNEFKKSEHDTIVNALKLFNNKTCIKLIPKEENENSDYILYKPGKGCGTLVGYNKLKSRPHEVVFNDYCLKLPEAIQHETMHVMGIFHEQCRWDRDEYIDILWKNIELNQRRNFIKIPKVIADSYGIEYDYNSIMHYGPTAFHKKGTNITMRVKQKKGVKRDNIKIGQLGYATEGDILKMNRMYNCKDHM